MKVRYIGPDLVAIEHGKTYDVISIEKGWYRIMTEIEEDFKEYIEDIRSVY